MPHPVKRLALICHPNRAAALEMAGLVLQWAKERHVAVRMDQEIARKLQHEDLGMNRLEMAKFADTVLVLGGDGSILEAVRSFAPDQLPVVGVNLGHLGFLTIGTTEDTFMILERLHLGSYIIQEHMMLAARVIRGGKVVNRATALNDFVIVKDTISRVIDVSVKISGTHVSSYRGDGVIFSSSTGSTAYSLSAGGPIVPPWVNLMIVCPLASHTLNARPVVTSDQEVLLAELRCTHSQVNLVCDGQEGFPLENGDLIEVSRSQYPARIVVLKSRNFFKVLRKKMKWGR